MKKLLILTLAVCVVCSVVVVAQDTMSKSCATGKAAAAPLKTLKGTVKAEGDKVTFTDDKGKSWDVMNPEELKAHDGHHVQLSAHVYADKDSIHVMSVKMLKGDAKSGEPTSKY